MDVVYAGTFCRFVGLSGGFAARMETGTDSKLLPTVFRAVTLNEYVSPAVIEMVVW